MAPTLLLAVDFLDGCQDRRPAGAERPGDEVSARIAVRLRQLIVLLAVFGLLALELFLRNLEFLVGIVDARDHRRSASLTGLRQSLETGWQNESLARSEFGLCA